MANDASSRFGEIMDRVEQGWGRWQDALRRVDDSDPRGASLARSLIRETAEGDEQAVEAIRSLVEDSTYQQLPASDSVEEAEDLAEALRIMELHHERLLGALDTVAETSEEIVAAVETKIGPLTWERYPDRASRLTTTGDASS